MKNRHIILALVVLALGCGKNETAPSVAKAPAAAPPASAAETPIPKLTVRGVVEETFDASEYTYMRLKTVDGELWAAVGKSAVKKGDEVTVVDAARMDGFESKTLNRTFDKIVFGNLGTPGNASGPADVGKIEVKRAEGARGRTVAELFAQKGPLKDREVSVRGKVVKFTGGVMGKNWIHLRDGSGTREGKNDDVTVTTTQVAAVGDVVLATGTVRLDKDFGAGYTYPVLIENAKLSK